MVKFKLKIVYPDGSDILFNGGGQIELDLIDACTRAIVAKGVGVFRTEAQVKTAIQVGMAEAIFGLKRESLKLL